MTIMAAGKKSYNCSESAKMIVKKTIKIPVHYDTTKSKIGILDNLTARITYCIRLISDLIDEDTKLDRMALNRLVKNSDIVEKTGLSAGYIQQCIDKVIWSWKSYRKIHKGWEKKKEKRETSLQKLLKREPSKPVFQDKTSCRLDYRTGKVESGKGKLSPLWIHISTLEKGKTIDLPLNPAQYHLNELKNAQINDFEILKHGKKYYVHISIMERLEKYDAIIASLQESETWDKLRELRNKRANVAVYHDWCLANKVAEFTEGFLVAIGNSRFMQTQYCGNGMPKLRKRIGKWSYGRQREFIALKRAEHGYPTELRDEYGTSRECHICHSMLTRRVWGDGYSYILCHSCEAKEDADINAAYNIAFRCRDDWLKVQMTMAGGKPHASA